MSTNSENAYTELLGNLPPADRTPADCQHEQFAACASVTRLEDTGRFICELRVVCVQCREPFRFKGMPPGLSFEVPTVSIDGLEANLPIEPEVEKRLFGGARFEMPRLPIQH